MALLRMQVWEAFKNVNCTVQPVFFHNVMHFKVKQDSSLGINKTWFSQSGIDQTGLNVSVAFQSGVNINERLIKLFGYD